MDAVPHCADPRHLYVDYVSTVYQAGSEARSATGPSGRQAAAVLLNGLKDIQSQLAAETNRVLATSG